MDGKFENLNDLIQAIKVPLDHPQFFARVFSLMSQQRRLLQARDGDNFHRIFAEEYDDLSKYLDLTKIQESCSVRNILKTRRLANLLINDQGELNTQIIPKLIEFLTHHLYFCGPDRQYDSKRNEQILRVLNLIQDNKNVVRLLKTITKPHANPYADDIIRGTLQLEPKTSVTDAHVRRAALSAWMCYLRQNVGSCFATALAIIIHDEQPETFLIDINDLLSTGRLKRTFGGIEYAVPLSMSWGAGDLKKPFYLYQDDPSKPLEIWQAPGFINALEAVSLISKDIPIKERMAQAKEITLDALEKWKGKKDSFFIVTIQDFLTRILLDRYHITEQDVNDFENRPRGLMSSSIFMQAPKASGGKGELCTQYLKDLNAAKKAFKSLSDNALLKAWEFTLASFSETKADFAKWNLYSSLGLRPEEPGGIGQCLYNMIKRKLDACNEKVNELQTEYEQQYAQVKFLEGRMKQASTEKEIQWLKVEYQMRINQFYLLEELRNKEHTRARAYASLFEFLIDFYLEKFPEYFQEVYDADMHDVVVGPYDDSPAGFRLLYKHGRANTSQWTMIYNHNEFVDALVNFFTATEHALTSGDQIKNMDKDIIEIVTSVVTHVKTQEFIESAFYRMAVAHNSRPIKDPLENLDKIEKKPWVYTSGGNMATLISCYYRRDQKPTEVSRWVENVSELYVYLIDSLKQIPNNMLQPVLQNNKSLLIHSPTHAFLLKPGNEKFNKALTQEAFTYTWVRDHVVQPMQKFVSSIYMNAEMMQYTINHLKPHLPENAQHLFEKAFSNMGGSMTAYDFRQYIVHSISQDRGLKTTIGMFPIADEIDSALHSLLPFFPHYQLRERLEKIFRSLPFMNDELFKKLFDAFHLSSQEYTTANVMSAKALQDIAKACFCLGLETTSLPWDVHTTISDASQQLGFAMPKPINFADTNWVKDEFAFVVNPGTGELELWRVDATGTVGAPMSSWKQWVNGSQKEPSWGIYIQPVEYNQ